MKEVYLLLKGQSGDILESYKFSLKYNPDNNKKSPRSLKENSQLIENITDLFHIINRLRDVEKLDNTMTPGLRITYNIGKTVLHNFIYFLLNFQLSH